MAGKREEVRADLTRRLLQAATARIEKHGFAGLRARDITRDADCGLGTIYKCFADLDDLIIHVNSGTLAKLHEALRTSIAGVAAPVEVLKALAFAYLEFARSNQNLWLALFVHKLPEGEAIPEWHVAENTALLQFIAGAVQKLEPDLDGEALSARARTYFAAVHGIVLISLQGRFVSLSGDVLEAELDGFVEQLAN